jgi:hypothetical protein
MIYFSLLHFARKEINMLESISWLVIWIVTIGIVIFPQLLQNFARTFAITRVFDLMVVGAFIVIIPMVYLSYIRTKKLEKKLEEYVRDDALKSINKTKSRK